MVGKFKLNFFLKKVMKKIHDMNLQMHTLIVPQFSTSLNIYDCVVWHLIHLENLKHQSMLCCRMTKCQASWSNKNGTMFKHEPLCIGSSICNFMWCIFFMLAWIFDWKINGDIKLSTKKFMPTWKKLRKWNYRYAQPHWCAKATESFPWNPWKSCKSRV